MTRIELSRRKALGALAGAMAFPTLARAQSATEVRAIIQYGVSYLPLMIIEEEKLLGAALAEQGDPRVELKLQRVSGSTAVNEGLLAGTADMGVMGVPSLLIIAEKTRGGVKGLANCSSFPMVLNTVVDRIKTIADFSPQDRIATPANTSPQNLCLRMAAEKLLGDAKKLDTNVVALPHPDAMAAMLAGTEVSAHFTNAPFAQFEADDKRVHRVLSSEDVLGKSSTFVLLAATSRFVDKNPKVAQAMVTAMDNAMKRIKEDPAKAAALYLSGEPSKSMNVEYVERILRDPENVFSVSPGGVMTFADFMQRTGQIKSKPAKWQDVFFPFIQERQGS
ncbi:ABC transporter substrate-binding protein [Bradyrhizobium sp. Ai1a-2]|uniref:ABC transporter substrate-binding protein n=1 Tax=Bradyrhizobium sp. Ai1a-2 TaxID=196490 RepID=UPI0004898B14|nr:ABC transporter substrate-binding protein [Bradyrhizobium sp. Ai1a-2]